MMSRILIAVLAILAAAYAFNPAVRANERPAIQTGEVIGSGFETAEALRVSEALRREKFAPVGEARRKGSLIILTAVQHGVPWRLVIDNDSGEIIGRRPLTDTISLSR